MARNRPQAPVPEEPILYDYKATRKMLGGIAQSTLEGLVAAGPDHGGIGSLTVGTPGSRHPRRMFTREHILEYVARRAAAATEQAC